MYRAHLSISRVGVENIAEEFARHRNAGNDQAVHVVHVDGEHFPTRLLRQLHHPVEVDEEGEEDLVARRTVLLNASEVCFECDGGNIPRVEGKGGGCGKGMARCGGQCTPYRRVRLGCA